MDGPRYYHIKFSSVQFSSVAQSCPTVCDPMLVIPFITYMWKPKQTKKRYKWTYLQNRNRLTDIENKRAYVDTVGETNCKIGIETGRSVVSCVRLLVTLWTVAHQAPLSMGISRQEYWSELPSPTPGDLPDPGIEHESLVSPVLAGGFFTTEPPGKFHF